MVLKGCSHFSFVEKPYDFNIIVDKFLENLYLDFDLRLFTTRNKLLASKWLIENNLDKYFSDITNIKELSWLIIDDRCLKFEGNYEDLIQKINNFKAWYK